MNNLDTFLKEVKIIIQTIENEQPIIDFGIHYTKKPYIYSEYVLCIEIANIYGVTLNEITKLGYEITTIEPIKDENSQYMRIFFKRK